MDLRPDVGVGVARIPLLECSGFLGEGGGESVGNLLVHENAGAREAHLPSVIELVDSEGRCQPDVGVLHHYEGALTTEFEGAGGEVVGRGPGYQLGGGYRAGERDARELWMRHERRARLATDSLHNVENSGGHSGLEGEVGEEGCAQRRPLSRFQHDGVSGGQGRADLPGGQHEWSVPRGDQGGDAGGIPTDVVGVAAGLESLVREVVDCPVGEEAQVVGHPGHDSAAVRAKKGSVVGGLDLGECLEVLFDQVGKCVQDCSTGAGAEGSPRGEGRFSRRDSSIHFGGATAGNVAEEVTVDR